MKYTYKILDQVYNWMITKQKNIEIRPFNEKADRIKIGDYITLVDKSTNKEYDLKIEGTIDYASGLSVFMNIKSLNTLLSNDEDYFNGYFYYYYIILTFGISRASH